MLVTIGCISLIIVYFGFIWLAMDMVDEMWKVDKD
ncbi:hypothetical protein vBAbaPP1_05 [Acinetobacter phage vB_AbaM_P1]|nr:hypothetical protein vBAbaPP1_184 [Acinetobacter phage vB_AbaM_P1]WHS04465.1 hypothetical protein vBAbaPP1_03 [Acinetobacter phage vB_AbaM_P1]WHS04467.1 hypothetical protein vBAbaPP1_05 [Acinetobacter phage vB_AbaM_P1]